MTELTVGLDDEYWMREALKLAATAYEHDEVPVGAVVVLNEQIIGRGYNEVESLKDATAHAEIIAITSASRTIDNWRLNDAVIYATVEPCPMCAGAILLSRISKCVFGTRDPRLGSLGSKYEIRDPRIEVVHGILENECKKLMESFFRRIRNAEKEEG
jgi:tRNA(adenine34) deaminase